MMLVKEKEVLNKVKRIIGHHKELAKAKGELFNIYDILNLQTKEVRTHSKFIAELLNPDGTHLMGDVFLISFLKLLGDKVVFDIKGVKVDVEVYIGERDDVAKVGGRIDILIRNSFGDTITIENKIDAEDQEAQIERYFNYNKNKNKVIYLSKFGDEPDKNSKGKLVSGEDFIIISYKEDIIQWLEEAQAIASDQPILRESIKQYKILIQKITNTLNDQQNKELRKVILNNIEEASYISHEFNSVINEVKSDFREKVIEFLKEDKTREFQGLSFSANHEVTKTYATIWFDNKKEIWFGVESFSGKGHLNGDLFIGIMSKGKFTLEGEFDSINKGWHHHQVLTHNNEIINLSNNECLQKLAKYSEMEKVAKEVADQIVSFVIKYKHLVY